MEIRKNTYHPAFGAHSVKIAEDVVGLGLEAVKAVQEAIPELQKLGTDKAVFSVTRAIEGRVTKGGEGYNVLTDSLLVEVGEIVDIVPPKTMIGKLLRRIFPQKQKLSGTWSATSAQHKTTPEVVGIAQKALEKMNSAKEAEQIMANIQASPNAYPKSRMRVFFERLDRMP